VRIAKSADTVLDIEWWK